MRGYASLRGELALDPATTLTLDEGFALHPSLERCKGLWDRGRLAVVHGVGFERLDRSHFHCMDVWHAGGVESAPTGWVGRWLDVAGADPLAAVVVGSGLPLLGRGVRTSAAVVPPGPFETVFDDVVIERFADQVAVDHDRNDLESLVARSGSDLLDVAEQVGGPLASMADDRRDARRPARRPSRIARGRRPAHAGLRRPSAVVSTPTPSRQPPTAGSSAISTARSAPSSTWWVDRTRSTVVVYSEFGRRVEPNGSGGTDHGRAGTVLVAGPGRGRPPRRAAAARRARRRRPAHHHRGDVGLRGPARGCARGPRGRRPRTARRARSTSSADGLARTSQPESEDQRKVAAAASGHRDGPGRQRPPPAGVGRGRRTWRP